MELSIIIPVYNEEERLPHTLGRIVNFFRQKRISFEIIVVNDGSSDGSKSIVERYRKKYEEISLIHYNRNMGKGYAVNQGVLKGTGDLFLFSDADLSTPIEEYEKLIRFIHLGYDIVIGSRRIRGADIKLRQPLHRRILGRGFGLLAENMLLKGIKDTQCGFKLFRKNIAKKTFSERKVDGFSFDVEILYVARKIFCARIKEVPVQWIDSAELSTLRVRRETFCMLRDLIRIRITH